MRSTRGAGLPFDSPRYIRCYDTAVDTAVASLDRPELTAYHQQRLVRSSGRLASQ
jgi:hypothetical protein